MIRIKSKVAALAILSVSLMNGLPTFAQQTDPALTGAVIAQTVELKNIPLGREIWRGKLKKVEK